MWPAVSRTRPRHRTGRWPSLQRRMQAAARQARRRRRGAPLASRNGWRPAGRRGLSTLFTTIALHVPECGAAASIGSPRDARSRRRHRQRPQQLPRMCVRACQELSCDVLRQFTVSCPGRRSCWWRRSSPLSSPGRACPRRTPPADRPRRRDRWWPESRRRASGCSASRARGRAPGRSHTATSGSAATRWERTARRCPASRREPTSSARPTSATRSASRSARPTPMGRPLRSRN